MTSGIHSPLRARLPISVIIWQYNVPCDRGITDNCQRGRCMWWGLNWFAPHFHSNEHIRNNSSIQCDNQRDITLDELCLTHMSIQEAVYLLPFKRREIGVEEYFDIWVFYGHKPTGRTVPLFLYWCFCVHVILNVDNTVYCKFLRIARIRHFYIMYMIIGFTHRQTLTVQPNNARVIVQWIFIQVNNIHYNHTNVFCK